MTSPTSPDRHAAHRNRTVACALLALTWIALPACQRTMVRGSELTSYAPGDLAGQASFWHNLPGRSAITNDEMVHGVLLLMFDETPPGGYRANLERLRELGWIGASFDEPGDMAAQRGRLASLLAHALGIDGGVMMRLTDRAPRYAHRELMEMGILPDGTEAQVLSGLDFLGVIAKAQDHMLLARQRQEPGASPASDGVSEPDTADDSAGQLPPPAAPPAPDLMGDEGPADVAPTGGTVKYSAPSPASP